MNFEWKVLKIKIENVTVQALYHGRFRALHAGVERFACRREAASAKAGHAGVSVVRVRYSRKITEKERERDANRDGQKN